MYLYVIQRYMKSSISAYMLALFWKSLPVTCLPRLVEA